MEVAEAGAGATESCITDLFDSNLFRFEQLEALRDEIRSGL